MRRYPTTDRTVSEADRVGLVGGSLRGVLNGPSAARSAEGRPFGDAVRKSDAVPDGERTPPEEPTVGGDAAVDQRPVTGAVERAVVVGDDPTEIRSVAAGIDAEVTRRVRVGESGEPAGSEPDGGAAERTVDDPAELEASLRDGDATLVALAFAEVDRAGFYRTLLVCRRCGVRAIVPNRHAEDVLVAAERTDGTVDVELGPWCRGAHLRKRAFDVAFATLGLLMLPPLCLLIAAAIRVEDAGPVFYRQRRTKRLGETFDVYKFRTMEIDAESGTGATLSAEDAGGVDPRVTRVGRVLRRTHLDEIPQLWSILVGDMSVVGPRPERPELDPRFDREARGWRRRWFVKPGLTGPAQIRGVSSHRPSTKLRYDLEYVRRQSLSLDVRIVLRQLGTALGSSVELFLDR